MRLQKGNKLFPRYIEMFDLPDDDDSHRINRYQYEYVSKQEYINWLLFIKEIQRSKEYDSLDDLLEHGIPIMLMPSNQSLLSEHMRELAEVDLIRHKDWRLVRLDKQTKAKLKEHAKKGFAYTVLLHPGNLGRESFYQSNELEKTLKYFKTWDVFSLSKNLSRLIQLGFVYEPLSSHEQQVLHSESKDTDFPAIPFVDFRDLIKFSHLSDRNKILLITRSLNRMYEYTSKTIHETYTSIKNEKIFPAEIDRSMTSKIISGLLNSLEIDQREVELANHLAIRFGWDFSFMYIAIIHVRRIAEKNSCEDNIQTDISKAAKELDLEEQFTSLLKAEHLNVEFIIPEYMERQLEILQEVKLMNPRDKDEFIKRVSKSVKRLHFSTTQERRALLGEKAKIRHSGPSQMPKIESLFNEEN